MCYKGILMSLARSVIVNSRRVTERMYGEVKADGIVSIAMMEMSDISRAV